MYYAGTKHHHDMIHCDCQAPIQQQMVRRVSHRVSYFRNWFHLLQPSLQLEGLRCLPSLLSPLPIKCYFWSVSSTMQCTTLSYSQWYLLPSCNWICSRWGKCHCLVELHMLLTLLAREKWVSSCQPYRKRVKKKRKRNYINKNLTGKTDFARKKNNRERT